MVICRSRNAPVGESVRPRKNGNSFFFKEATRLGPNFSLSKSIHIHLAPLAQTILVEVFIFWLPQKFDQALFSWASFCFSNEKVFALLSKIVSTHPRLGTAKMKGWIFLSISPKWKINYQQQGKVTVIQLSFIRAGWTWDFEWWSPRALTKLTGINKYPFNSRTCVSSELFLLAYCSMHRTLLLYAPF